MIGFNNNYLFPLAVAVRKKGTKGKRDISSRKRKEVRLPLPIYSLALPALVCILLKKYLQTTLTHQTLRLLAGILAFAVSPALSQVVTSHRSGLLKCWEFKASTSSADASKGSTDSFPTALTLLHAWKGHPDLVTDLSFSPNGDLLATSSLDGSVKVWDMAGYFVTHNFTSHSSTPILVRWGTGWKSSSSSTSSSSASVSGTANNRKRQQYTLFSGDDEGEIRVYDLLGDGGKAKQQALKQHLGQVRARTLAHFQKGRFYIFVSGLSLSSFLVLQRAAPSICCGSSRSSDSSRDLQEQNQK